VVDAKALWFGIPTTEIAQERYTRLLSEPVHPKVENQQLGTEIPQRDNEDLQQQCFGLSGKLFQFSEMRKKEDPRNTPGWKPGNPFSSDPESRRRAQEQKNYDDETWTQYRRQYEGELWTLLDALEQRGHCNPKERKEIENELVIFWRPPAERIERVAARLDALGKRL